MPYASTTELATLLGRSLTTAEESKATLTLELVDLAIDEHLDGRVADADTTRLVALSAGRRAFLNPDGVRQEVLGDWQASYDKSELLTGQERRLLDSGVGITATRRRRHGSPRIIADVWFDTAAGDLVV